MKITSSFLIIVICSIFLAALVAIILSIQVTKKSPERVIIIPTHSVEKTFSNTEIERILTPVKE